MALTPGTRIGPYEITGPLGAGGMGEVYRAHDARLNRDVAIKILPELFARDAERLARFEREAQSLAALNHPNIAQIYGVVENALVMEYVDGEDLAQRIARGALPLEEALTTARQIAEALEGAHDRGIIHRDLKPANIKVTGGGAVKVLDFGLAKAMDGAAALSPDPALSPTLTSPPQVTGIGAILGTAAYMSPEQAKGMPADRRADIWAFGCVLYEMLTGKRPFGGEGDSIAEVLAATLKSDVPWAPLPAATPLRVRELLRRCLEKDPRRRLQSMGEARAQLEEILAGAAEGAPLAPVAGTRSSSKVPWALAATLGVALAGTLAWAVGGRESPPMPRPVRFTIPFEEPLNGFSLSPDGSQLVYAARYAGGGSGLWLRRFDMPESWMLPGTAGGQTPFWSPDGRSIGFFAGGRLKRFDTTARAVQIVCAVSSAPASFLYRGVWAPDDSIIFIVPDGDAFRVPAAGGSPTLIVLDTDRRAAVRLGPPQMLADGRRFIAPVLGAGFGTLAGSLDAPGLTKVSDDRSVLGAPDMLLLAREDAIAAQRVDPKTLAPIGTFQTLLLAPVTAISVSGNGVLAYRTPRDVDSHLAWVDRSGRQIGAIGAPGIYYMPRISRDGARVAFEQHNAGNFGDVQIFDTARGVTTRLTFDPTHHNAGATWSPTGDRLLFHSTRDGKSLYMKALSGMGAEELFFKSQAANPTDWSPDGTAVLVDLVHGVPPGIYALPVAGAAADRRAQPLIVVRDATAMQGQFSPDGKWLAYASNESGAFEVYLSPFPATGAKMQVSNGGGDTPRWNRNGKELFYIGPDLAMMATPVTLGASVEVGKAQRLFQTAIRHRGASDFMQYDVAPDGQRFLIVSQVGSSSALHVVVNWPSLLRDAAAR